MSGVVPAIPRLKFTNATGVPVVSGSVAVYLAGTNTLANTYQDKALTILNNNPVPLDGNGEALFWLDPSLTYKFLLKDANNATVTGWPVDNILGGGNSPTLQQSYVDTFSGTGSQTVFTLSAAPGNVKDTNVYVGGVYQKKSAYNLAGSTLTFVSAPTSGTNNIEVTYYVLLDFTGLAATIAGYSAAAAASASDAQTSALAASTSETNAAGSVTAINNRIYPGTYTTAPTTRPDGSARQSGDEYFDATANKRYTFNGATWVASDINTANLAASSGSSLVGFIQAGTGAVARTLQDRERDLVFVTDFYANGVSGAKVDPTGVTDSTLGIQAAINSLPAGGGTVIFPPGTYKVVCLSASPFYYGNDPSTLVYRAVSIQKSNLTLIGFGATIKVIGFATSAAVNYAFGTSKNLNIGDLTNIRVRNLRFDFDPTGDSSVNKRSFYFGGVQGLFLDDIEITSSGARAGGTMTFQQCKTVRINNFRHKNCTQGMNFSFVTDVVGANWQFDNFSEAVDFDRQVVGLHLSNLSFINAQNTSQCLDLNSVQDAKINGVYVNNVGNICIVNYKATTPPTYAEYLLYTNWHSSRLYLVGDIVFTSTDDCYQCVTGGTSASSGGPTGQTAGITDGTVVWNYIATPFALTPSKRVTISGIRGDTAGLPANATISLGIDRTAKFTGSGPCENITVEDVRLKNCSFLNVEDVKDLVLRDIQLENVNSPTVTPASYGAITLTADATYADAELSGLLENVKIINADHKGIFASAPTRLEFNGVRVDGFNSSNTASCGYAFDMAALNNRRGQLFINRTLAKSGQNSPIAWRFSESGAGSFASQIYWGDGNRIDIATVPTAVLFGQAGTQKRIKKRMQIPVGTFTLSSGTMDRPLLAPTSDMGMTICWVSAILSQAVASNATNFITHNTRSNVGGSDGGISSSSFTAGQAAAVEGDLGISFSAANRQLGPNDIAYIRFGVTGTGGTLQGLSLQAHYIDYATS